MIDSHLQDPPSPGRHRTWREKEEVALYSHWPPSSFPSLVHVCGVFSFFFLPFLVLLFLPSPSFPFLLPPLPPPHSPLLSCFRSLALELPRLLLLELGRRGLGAFGCWSCCCVHFCNMKIKAGRVERIISLLCWSEFHYFRLQIFI